MKISKETLRLVGKTAIRVIVWTIFCLSMVFASLQLPIVQTYLAKEATSYFSEKLGFPITIEAVSIRWLDIASFKNVKVADPQGHQMIEIPDLTVDFYLLDLISGKDIWLDEVTLGKAKIKLVVDKKTGDLNIDEFVSAINRLGGPKVKTNEKKTYTLFGIKHIVLEEVLFQYIDERKDSIKDGFDYHHISLNQLNGDAYNFYIVADTVGLKVRDWSAVEEKINWPIHSFNTDFRLTDQNMIFDKLDMKIGQSILSDSLVFNYQSTKDLSDFVEKVKIAAHLKGTKIYTKDLALFAPLLKKYEDFWSVNGNFRGRVNRFRVKDFDLMFGSKSHLYGNVNMDGLPDFESTFINIDILPSILVASDVRQYVDTASYHNVKKFGSVKFQSKFQGFTNDFIANGIFETDLGSFSSDVDLKLKGALPSYKGKVTTTGFNLGKLLDQEDVIDKIDMNGQIEGKGLRVANADFTLKAKVSKIGIYGYNYQNIDVNGNLSSQRFKGKMVVKDQNLAFDANGEVDLRKNVNFFNIKADLIKADFQAIGFSKTTFQVKSKLDVTFQGLDIDKINGDAKLSETEITYGNRSLLIDSLFVRSQPDNDEDSLLRGFDFVSDFFNVHAHGNFKYTQLFSDIKTLVKEYDISLRNDRVLARKYYDKKSKKSPLKYAIEYNIHLQPSINELLVLFVPDIHVSPDTKMEGTFSNGKNTIFAVNGSIDTIFYGNYKFFTTTFDFNTSKLYKDASILASGFIRSEKQDLSRAALTEKMSLEAVWSEDHIEFTGKIRQQSSSNFASLNADLKFFEDRTEVKFKPSKIKVLDKIWKIDSENLITVKGENYRDIHFQNVKLANDFHSIALQGDISQDTTKSVNLTIQDFDVSFINPILSEKLEGNANGYVNVKDVYHNFIILSHVNVEELVVNKFFIGDIDAQVGWDNLMQKLNLNSSILRYNNQILTAYGTYDPANKESPMNVSIVLDEMDLEILEPFSQGEVSKLGGKATGFLRLTGTIAIPNLKGSANIINGRFKYNYLNTSYTFNDKIYFTDNSIIVKNLKLKDDGGNVAVVKGGVFHDGFKNFVLDVKATMQNFKVLNTASKDNSMYYGTAVVTGDFKMFGPIDNMEISANAKTNKGTKIFIPISDASEIGNEDYIVFVKKSDKKGSSGGKKRKITGLKLDFNLDITSDAYCEIIFDIRTGEIIRGNGNGKIKLNIDTKGDFSMYGDYVIEKGSYNFVLYEVINKEFSIRSGSRISWNGDPYQAILNLQASYLQMTSLLPILNTTDQSNPAYTRRYPVTVLMDLSGNLMSPLINLGIEIKDQDYPKDPAFLGVMSFLSKIKNDEQELNRQVFSLIVLKKLQPEGNFNGVQGSVVNSLSELLSNQLSNWISQVDEDLEIDVNINSMDQNSYNNFQVRMSYLLLGGRLRITRNGNFGDVNQSAAQSIIGEWTIEYLISKDGRFKLKMYNKNTQNTLNTLSTSNNTMAGFSILHTESFNSLGELLRRKKKKKQNDIPVEDSSEPPISDREK